MVPNHNQDETGTKLDLRRKQCTDAFETKRYKTKTEKSQTHWKDDKTEQRF
jgi:hypothetical protein